MKHWIRKETNKQQRRNFSEKWKINSELENQLLVKNNRIVVVEEVL